MSINWSTIGSNISSLTSALSAAGVSASSLPGILSTIGLSSNPNATEEQQICQQIMLASANPSLVAALQMKLATEIGLPQDAIPIVMSLTTPGVDIPTKVLQIETLIKSGG